MTSPTTARLDVANLGFRYPRANTDALRDISFALHSGEALGVLGANGSGKSTLLNAVLATRVGTRRGEVSFDGSPNIPRDDIGFATQAVALYPQLTVLENLRHAARTLLRRGQVRAAVTDAVDEHRLGSVVDTPVHRLSGGWQRITNIAVAFVHRPRVRFLDEPTAALDFEARAALVSLIDSWRRSGALILVTSHYPEDIEEICTHALVIRDGVTARHATLAEVLGQHRRQLRIVADTVDGPMVLDEPAPRTAGEARAVLDRVVAEAELREIRLTGNTFRTMLQNDPHLRGVLDDSA